MARLPSRSAVAILLLGSLMLFPLMGQAQEVEVEWVSSLGAGPAWDVAVENDYAYLAVTTGLQVVDLSDPDKPAEVAFLGLPGLAREVVVEEGIAYVAAQKGGLWTVDIQEPDDPRPLGSYQDQAVYGLDVKEGIVLAATEKAGLLVIDATDPGHPLLVGLLDDEPAYEISIQGELAFIENGSGAFNIYDLHQPRTPDYVSRIETGREAESVILDQDRAYVSAAFDGLMIFDLSTLSSPVLLGSYDTQGYAFDMVMTQDRLYLSDWSGGLLVLDVSDPAAPELVEQFDSWGNVKGLGLYNHYLIVANENNGMKVLDLTNPDQVKTRGELNLVGTAYDLELVEKTLFVADGTTGLEVYDLFDAQHPNLLYRLDTPGLAMDVLVTGSVAFVADGEAGVMAVDISEPLQLRQLGWIDTPGYARSLALEGSQLYVADSSEGFAIVNVQDPSNMTLLYQMGTFGEVYDVLVEDEVAYLAEEDTGVVVMDLSNPLSPQRMEVFTQLEHPRTLAKKDNVLTVTEAYYGIFSLDTTDPDHLVRLDQLDQQELGGWSWGGTSQSQTWVGDLLVVARGTKGLAFLDLSDPSNMVLAATYDSAERAYDAVYYQQQFYVANGKAGLQVVDLGLPRVAIDYVLPETARQGQNLTLLGSVYDPAGGSWTYNWSSSEDGELGQGEMLVTAALSPGRHTLTLEVTNDLGMRGQAVRVSVTVLAVPGFQDPEPDEPGNVPDGLELNSRLVMLVSATVLLSALSSIGYSFHSSGETGRYQLFAALAPLMARRKERRSNDPLAHETRGFIRGYLLANPGAHYRMLKSALKLTNGTLAHHLMIMEREGLVVSRRRGQLRCFYLISEGVGEAIPAEGDQLSPTQEHLMNLVQQHPGISQKDLAIAMNMTAAAVKYNIDQLLERELVRRERRGMWVSYYLAPPRIPPETSTTRDEPAWSRFRP